MANYYGAARSNYFTVVDSEKFENDMEFIPGIDFDTNSEGRYSVWVGNDDSGGWPGWVQRDMLEEFDDPENENMPAWLRDATADEVEIDLPAIVAEHLADGEVAIFMESGAEKLRYVVGYTEAINNKGERKTISLNDIYDFAKDMTDRPDDVSTAEY